MAVAVSEAEPGNPSADAAQLVEPAASARAAGLRYVSDQSPGIRRKRVGKGFAYLDSAGRTVRDPETIRRIKRLTIPPAWTHVWICADPRGHLQATGRDARGRKQYRYHPRWRGVPDAVKYDRMLAFAESLPKIRKHTDRDLERPGLPREKVLATIVRLLEDTRIRVGNDEYRKENGSYGLTTLRNRHVNVIGAEVRFTFRGKSGKQHTIELHDRRMARIIKRFLEIPGQELFQYVDGDGEVKAIDSADVNEYLHEITGQDFTAKDFRTWAGTVLAARALQEFEQVDSAAQAKKNVVHAIEQVAMKLGNTRAVCRKCYIHPAVIDSYMDGSLLKHLSGEVNKMIKPLHRLRPEEAAVLVLLQRRLTSDVKSRN